VKTYKLKKQAKVQWLRMRQILILPTP
jgi:hypothetical protein